MPLGPFDAAFVRRRAPGYTCGVPVQDDLSLLRAWRKGDKSAGEALVERHFASVYGFFANKSDCPADLTQQTFVACMEGLDRIRDGSRFRAYLLGVARNQLLRYLRARKRWKQRFQLGSVSIEAVLCSPSQVASEREEGRIVLAALRKMSIEKQMLLELFYWEDLSTAEVAEVVMLKQSTVKARLVQARAELAQRIREMDLASDVRNHTLDNLEQWAKELRDLAAASNA